jgi:hypothetical protein
MTERARHPDACQVIVGVNGCLEADDRIHLQQRDGRRRALEIDLVEEPGRQDVRVHFQPDLQRGRRIRRSSRSPHAAAACPSTPLRRRRCRSETPLALGDAGVRICRLSLDSPPGALTVGSPAFVGPHAGERDGRDRESL